jgi:hypothetical protein
MFISLGLNNNCKITEEKKKIVSILVNAHFAWVEGDLLFFQFCALVIHAAGL